MYFFFYHNLTEIFIDLSASFQWAPPSWYATLPTGHSTGLAWASSLPLMWTLTSAPMWFILWPPSALITSWSRWNGMMRTCTNSWTTWSWRKWRAFLFIFATLKTGGISNDHRVWQWLQYSTYYISNIFTIYMYLRKQHAWHNTCIHMHKHKCYTS